MITEEDKTIINLYCNLKEDGIPIEVIVEIIKRFRKCPGGERI